jgi:HPt (histidine-containing phosphotransfer) domain-containing protein
MTIDFHDPSFENLLDTSMLDTLRDIGGKELIVELVDEFRKGESSWIEAVSSSASQGDLVEARKAAHGLKGSAGQMGARQIAAISQAIEKACIQEEIQTVINLVSPLREAFKRTCIALEQEKEKPAST